MQHLITDIQDALLEVPSQVPLRRLKSFIEINVLNDLLSYYKNRQIIFQCLKDRLLHLLSHLQMVNAVILHCTEQSTLKELEYRDSHQFVYQFFS